MVLSAVIVPERDSPVMSANFPASLRIDQPAIQFVLSMAPLKVTVSKKPSRRTASIFWYGESLTPGRNPDRALIKVRGSKRPEKWRPSPCWHRHMTQESRKIVTGNDQVVRRAKACWHRRVCGGIAVRGPAVGMQHGTGDVRQHDVAELAGRAFASAQCPSVGRRGQGCRITASPMRSALYS